MPDTARRRLRSRCAAALLLLLAACRPDEAPPPPAGAPAEQTPAARAEEAYAGKIAVTIDDLPWVGAVRPGETRLAATDRLLGTLARHGAPAGGFVICEQVDPGAAIPRRWLEAGQPLGNHTAAHRDLNTADLDLWLADVRSCDAELRRLTGRDSLFFRYPYLHQGPTRERYEAALETLEDLDSPIAHVTIDTSDWILAVAYGDALRAGDRAAQEEIGAAFVDHILRATRHYQEVARRKVGRDVSHVLLLHANALVADHLDPLLDRLRREGFEFVSLEQAQTDPVYRRPDGYIGPRGLSWLYRMQPATPEDAAWDDAEAERLRARYRR